MTIMGTQSKKMIIRIFRFCLEAKEIKTQSQKDDYKRRKYAANICQQNLQTELIPTLYIGQRFKNVAIFMRTIWKRYDMICKNDPAANFLYTVKKNAGPLKSAFVSMRSMLEAFNHV